MPSCMLLSSVQRLLDCTVERLETFGEIALEMHAQRTPATLGEHAEIASRLRCLDHAKAGLLARHRQILRVVGGDLQEHAAVRTAFIGLTRRMQETRTEFRAGRDM